jgi:hypothetical protein
MSPSRPTKRHRLVIDITKEELAMIEALMLITGTRSKRAILIAGVDALTRAALSHQEAIRKAAEAAKTPPKVFIPPYPIRNVRPGQPRV